MAMDNEAKVVKQVISKYLSSCTHSRKQIYVFTLMNIYI